MKLKVPCHEANHICDKNQYREATFWEKIKLNFHLIYCNACRKYSARNTKLTKALHRPEVHSISITDKNAMKKQLDEQLSNQ